MKIVEPGHTYELWTMHPSEHSAEHFGFHDHRLTFVRRPVPTDPDREDVHDGTTCQEVLRAVIDRVRYLDGEEADEENAGIVADLRRAILRFELRALRRRIEKVIDADLRESALHPETFPIGPDGHWELRTQADVDREDEAEAAKREGRDE